MDLVAQVIEGEHAIEEHQHAIGNVEIVDGVLADVLQSAHDVVGAIADRAGCEWRQAFHGRGTMLLQEFFDDVENISRAALDFVGRAAILMSSAARFEPQKRAHAEKRIASNFFSAFDRFQQKGVRLSSATARKAETGVSRSAEIDFATGTSVASRDSRANSL